MRLTLGVACAIVAALIPAGSANHDAPMTDFVMSIGLAELGSSDGAFMTRFRIASESEFSSGMCAARDDPLASFGVAMLIYSVSDGEVRLRDREVYLVPPDEPAGAWIATDIGGEEGTRRADVPASATGAPTFCSGSGTRSPTPRDTDYVLIFMVKNARLTDPPFSISARGPSASFGVEFLWNETTTANFVDVSEFEGTRAEAGVDHGHPIGGADGSEAIGLGGHFDLDVSRGFIGGFGYFDALQRHAGAPLMMTPTLYGIVLPDGRPIMGCAWAFPCPTDVLGAHHLIAGQGRYSLFHLASVGPAKANGLHAFWIDAALPPGTFTPNTLLS